MGEGLGLNLPPECSRLFGYVDTRGWSEASTQTMTKNNLGRKRFFFFLELTEGNVRFQEDQRIGGGIVMMQMPESGLLIGILLILH